MQNIEPAPAWPRHALALRAALLAGCVALSACGASSGSGNTADSPPPATNAQVGETPNEPAFGFANEPPLETPQATLDKALDCTPFTHPDKSPVLLVPGTGTLGQEDYSWSYKPLLVERGFDVCIVTPPDRGLVDMQISAEYIVNALRRIRAESGRKVAMIGVSQGGTMPRWALKWWPSAREAVEDYVMNAGPNHGTAIAGTPLVSLFGNTLGLLPEVVFQFAPESNFVHALNAGDETPGDVSYTSLYSQFDEAVQPASPVPTAALDLGQDNPKVANILLQDVCPGRLVDHMTIGATDRVAFELMLDAISHPGPANIERVIESAGGNTKFCGLLPLLPDQIFPADALTQLLGVPAMSFANGAPEYHLAHQEPPLRPYARTKLDARAELVFAPAAKFAAGERPFGMATGDVNGDGRPDVAVANLYAFGAGAVTLLVNTTTAPGAPSFAPAIGFDAASPSSVALADLDGDGRPELIIGDQPVAPFARVRVYPNTTAPGAATPTFAAPLTLPTSGNFLARIAVADMNRDGRPDLVILNAGTTGADAITVLRNTSAGPGQLSFAAPQNFDGGNYAEGLSVADLNGDGLPEVITANTVGQDVTILTNQTLAGASVIRLAPAQHFPAPTGPAAVVAVDLNGDGKLDLAVGSAFTALSGADELTVMLNQTPQGSATMSFTHQTFKVDLGIEGITAADFDGNGRPDLATAAYESATGVAVLRNTTPAGAAKASFEAPVRLAAGGFATGSIATVIVAAADFDGDGRADLAAINHVTLGLGGLVVFINQTP